MNRHGQSTIEYALIAVLVILGIVVMGPYVLRSVNAHFKLWDEGVQDSTRENLTQAPVADVPPINVDCSCPALPGSCNTTNCGIGYREYDYNCTPQGCNHASNSSYCKVDGSCCGLPVNLNCGSYPLPTDASGNINLSAETTPQPPTPGNCYYGQEITGTTCGTTSSIQCVPNSCPMPACLGSISETHTQACTNGPPGNGKSLSQNYGITFVGDVSSCAAGAPCQYSCTPPYQLTNGNCEPPPPPPPTCFNNVWADPACFSRGGLGATGNACMYSGGNDNPADSPGQGWDTGSYICVEHGFNQITSIDGGISGCNSGACASYVVTNGPRITGPSDLTGTSFRSNGAVSGCNSCYSLHTVCCTCATGYYFSNGSCVLLPTS